MKLAIKSIKVGERARDYVKPNDLRTVQASMAKDGLTHPLLVYVNDAGGYWLLDGLCRLTAAKNLKWKEIDVIVQKFPVDMHPKLAALHVRMIELDTHLGVLSETIPSANGYDLEIYEKTGTWGPKDRARDEEPKRREMAEMNRTVGRRRGSGRQLSQGRLDTRRARRFLAKKVLVTLAEDA